jgi:AraC-like DNA-binding protein
VELIEEPVPTMTSYISDSQSYQPADAGESVLDISVGDALRAAAGRSAADNTDRELWSDGPMPLRTAPCEINRLDPSPEVVRTVETTDAHVTTLRLQKRNSVVLEFFMPSHLLILFNDGISRGCEWTDGAQFRRLPSVAPNTIIFNPALKYLRIRTDISHNCCHALVLKVHPSIIGRLNGPINREALQFEQRIGLSDEGVSQALIAMQQELETPGINSVFYVDTLSLLLLTRLIRCASNFATPLQSICAKGGLPNWRLKRAIDLLKGDPSKMPTLSAVAGAVGLHPTSFCRAFKQSTGLSPHRYFLVQRVDRAKEMMKDQKLSLTEIALDCGFSGSSHFSIVFKRVTGMTPREFRRRL